MYGVHMVLSFSSFIYILKFKLSMGSNCTYHKKEEEKDCFLNLVFVCDKSLLTWLLLLIDCVCGIISCATPLVLHGRDEMLSILSSLMERLRLKVKATHRTLRPVQGLQDFGLRMGSGGAKNIFQRGLAKY